MRREIFQCRLLSPPTFEVARYLKGTGGSEILAQTALSRDEETGQLARGSAMVDPTAEQSWVLFGEFDELVGEGNPSSD